MSFGEKLAKLRKDKGMSQEDLASELNVSRQAVSKWESNSSYPETDKIIAICKLFNCSMDELIGLKEGVIKKNNNVFNNISKYFDMIIKGIKLFYSMTFKQKIKCLFEMCFYGLLLICFFIVINSIVIEIITKLLSLIPYEILMILIQTFRGILYLVYFIITIYILVKLYKIRYLDYYEEYNEKEEIENIKKETDKVAKINIKEEKIIIRDSSKEFRFFSSVKKLCLISFKALISFLGIGFAFAFVILIACTIFVSYFIDYGNLIIFIAIGLLGALIGLYVILEIIIKFIFDMKQSPKRLFIMFIVSMIIVGISGGFFTSELTTYEIIDQFEYNKKIHEETIVMSDNLIIDFLNLYNTEIIYTDREDILVEFYGADLNIAFITPHISQYSIDCNCYGNINCPTFTSYGYYTNHYFNGLSVNETIKEILSFIKNKKIIVEDIAESIHPKVYISKDNYNKILKNQKELNNNLDYCE